MAKTFKHTRVSRVRDRMLGRLIRRGSGPPGLYLLTVTGRKSGLPHTTPVTPLEQDGTRWLIAAFGPDGWARNARAAGRVTLARGGDVRTYEIEEVPPQEAAPVLKRYVTAHPRTVGPYFDVGKDSSLEEYAAEAPRHPVFRLTPAQD